ncbi:hypothetical protein [Dongia deserti]|uniref:hypothetical protein n=1 Tax=Dongia deserti TaxID=2268030 RepID=UPI0013C4193E|nr:hypothetical protein [Dongia deserti]
MSQLARRIILKTALATPFLVSTRPFAAPPFRFGQVYLEKALRAPVADRLSEFID